MAKQIQGYWRLVDPVWDQIDIYNGADVFLRTYIAVEKRAGLLFAAHFAQSEICNGGFHQLFGNSTGVLVPEAAEGFQALGMVETAQVVRTAMRLLGDKYPRDRDERQSILEGISRESLNGLDETFFALREKENGGFERSADIFATEEKKI